MNLAIGLRNLRRVRHILSVLVNYGFGYAFDQLGLANLLPVGRRREALAEFAGIPGPRRLRLALAELGPTFIKLGQVLSARADLLPASVVSELRQLQDQGPLAPFDQVRGVLEAELGRPLEECFARFEQEPLSSASLGQVHAAVLPDGREVTVKVLRPGVREVVEADLQILSDGAHLLHRQVPQLRRYDLPGFVRRFADQIEDELVYTIEAYNAERMGRALTEAGRRVRVPEVVWELTTPHVLTTARVHGARVDRLTGAEPGLDRAAAARELAQCMLQQVFVDGFFHGDPHQGNVLLAEDGTLLLLDFGIVGYLDPRTRRLLAEAVRRIVQQDLDGLLETMSHLGSLGPETDFTSLRSDLSRIIARLQILPPGQLSMGDLLSRTLRAMWTHHIVVSPELSLAAKALLLMEAICSELDPSFDLPGAAQAVVEEARRRALSPQAVAERLVRGAEAAARRLSAVPTRLERVLSLLESGGLRVHVESPEAERGWASLARGVNRVALSLLAGALLVSGSVLLSATVHPATITVAAIAIALGGSLGLALLLSLLRPGRL